MKRLIQILQLDHKWVRVMLGVSTLAILGLVFIPKFGVKKEMMMQKEIAAADTVAMYAPAMADSVVANYKEFEPMVTQPIPPALIDKDGEFIPEPVAEEAAVEEKEPFDWKETITWIIGAMNALVLVLLNVKNLLLKKST